jgi:predicted DNA-binding ribbon-helix-helix protein
MSRPVKHSITLRGHRTSVSLEPEFWAALREIAAARGLALSALIAEIDAQRSEGEDFSPQGLSSTLRVFVLETVRQSG